MKLARQVAANGSSQVGWRCYGCERWAETRWYGHDEVKNHIAKWGYEFDQIPVVADYRSNAKCAVCGTFGGEIHHFAPQSLREFFGEEWMELAGGVSVQKAPPVMASGRDLVHAGIQGFRTGPSGEREVAE